MERLDWYCARVIGWTSGPVLSISAMSPFVHTCWSGARFACSPKRVPVAWASGTRLACGSASDPRPAEYTPYSAPCTGTTMLLASFPP